MTTLCEMEFSNILWLICVRYLPLPLTRKDRPPRPHRWGPNLGAPFKTNLWIWDMTKLGWNFYQNHYLGIQLGFKWCTHGPHSGGSYVGGGGTLPVEEIITLWIQPIYLKIGPIWPNRQCSLAGSFQTAPRILIFSIAIGTDYSFYVKTIETHTHAFFKVIIFSIGIVGVHPSMWEI